MPITSSVVCLLLALLAGPVRQLIPVPTERAGNPVPANVTRSYPTFSYLVRLAGPNQPGEVLGGFSEVSGLKASHRNSDVTLKRGIVDSSELWSWLDKVRQNQPQARRTVIIILRDEAGRPAQSWKLQNTVPRGYHGPNLAGKSNDVAIEELEISAESLTIVPNH